MKNFQVIYVSDWDDARANVENSRYNEKSNALDEIRYKLENIMSVEGIVIDKELDKDGNVISYVAYFEDGFGMGWEKCQLVELD